MSLDPNAAPSKPASNAPPSPATQTLAHKGMKIFTYPKIIFLMPTLFAALICGIGMTIIRDNTSDPTKVRPGAVIVDHVGAEPHRETTEEKIVTRFRSTQNLIGVLFLGVLAINLIILGLDFPRFTVVLIVVAAAAVTFFLLWLSAWYDWIPPVVRALESVFAVANAQFYFLFASIIIFTFAIIFVTRYLDYWEILPNEILHNHGPFSDLERFPTTGLKFDKEIPDILEYAILRSGRLILHVANERKAIVLDNVLFIHQKEQQLKKLMSRLEVRITTDQEAAEPI
jgi:hypothetical protein